MHAIVRCRTEYPCATPMQSMTTSAYIQSHSAKNSHRNWYVHRSEYSVCGHNKPQLLYIYSLQVLKEWAEKWAMGESISEFFQAGFWNLSKPCLILNHWLRNKRRMSQVHFISPKTSEVFCISQLLIWVMLHFTLLLQFTTCIFCHLIYSF